MQTAKRLNRRDLLARLDDPASPCWREGLICTAHLSLFDPNADKCDFMETTE